MISSKINLHEKFSKFSKHWSPRVIAEMNNYQFKIAKIKGEFVWHDHKDTDETFIVIEGEMTLKFKDSEVKLSEGEMFVVPKGVEHKPCAEKECKSLLNKKLALPAYDQCLKASHIFNLLDARGVIGVAERSNYIDRIRDLAKGSGKLWLENQ